MLKNIQLRQDKTKQTFTVLINDKVVYNPFTYDSDVDEQTNVRRMAKAAAFDEACREIIDGNKITISFLVF